MTNGNDDGMPIDQLQQHAWFHGCDCEHAIVWAPDWRVYLVHTAACALTLRLVRAGWN